MTEMLKASSDICSMLIADLTNSIIQEIPSEWDDFIFSKFKGKGEAIKRGSIMVKGCGTNC